MSEPTGHGAEREGPTSELRDSLAALQVDVDVLQTRADQAEARADKSEALAQRSDARAEESKVRADRSEARADRHEEWLNDLQTQVDIDRELRLELDREGLLREQQVTHLQTALTSSRRIGAAIGIVMARLLVNEEVAFAVLKKASNDRNVKLTTLADSLVTTGDVDILLPATRRSRRPAAQPADAPAAPTSGDLTQT